MNVSHSPSVYTPEIEEMSPQLSRWRSSWTMSTILGVLVPLIAFVGWLLSLRGIDLGKMNDLGLVSIFTPLTLFSLALLMLSFCLALRQKPLNTYILLFHVLLLIFMLYGVTSLLEAEPRFSVVYRHAGFTEYIMRNGSVDPGLDAYFNWPGFFILSAFITRIVGYKDILAYAAWSPAVFNLLYLSPLYMIFTSITRDKRVVWLGLWFFFLTNWIGQDYFSPQGLNFFMYLVIIAILLTWFRMPAGYQPHFPDLRGTGLKQWPRRLYAWLRTPDEPGAALPRPQRIALLVCLLLIFFFTVFSHPLTPFFVLMSVWALVLFRRCLPFWLPIVMTLMTVAWIAFMAQAYLVGHFSDAFGSGGLSSSVTSNLTQHVTGDAQHTFIAQIRIVMTVFVWGLAALGGIRRFRAGYHDVTPMLLALAPFPLLVAQSYGGEMLLRIYLFALPMMVFFMASLFYVTPERKASRWIVMASIAMSLFLLGGFLFTRYGNESMDYMTTAEVTGVRYLYTIAQSNSLLIAGWDGSPWQFENFEKYDVYTLGDILPETVMQTDSKPVLHFIEANESNRGNGRVYMLFTRSQKRTVDATAGLAPGALDRLEATLLSTGRFQVIYHNSDAQVLLYTPPAKGK